MEQQHPLKCFEDILGCVLLFNGERRKVSYSLIWHFTFIIVHPVKATMTPLKVKLCSPVAPAIDSAA